MGLVGKVIKDKVHDVNSIGIFTYDDIFQIGCVGLCKAADTYIPGKCRFSTYAYLLIRNEIFDALDYATLRREREELTDFGNSNEYHIHEMPDESIYDIDNMLDRLQHATSGVIAKGIAAIRLLAQGYTHREVGERMGGVNANNVSAWVAKARKYLRLQADLHHVSVQS